MNTHVITKATTLLALIGSVIWLVKTSKWEPTVALEWEPAIIFIGLLGALIVEDIIERRSYRQKIDPIAEMNKFNPEIRTLLTSVSALYGKEPKSADIQGLVQKIASTIAQIHFDETELPLPKNSSARVFDKNESIDCRVCRAGNVDVYASGYCPRCKFECRSWMQIKG